MLRYVDIPPVWLLGFAALAWAQAQVVPWGAFGAWGKVAGAVLVVAGIGLAIAAALEFRRHRTTVIPHQEPSAIVTTGVFALTRNPIYLGDAAILLGLVLWWDAVPSLIVVPIFVLLIGRRFISAEEQRLARAFPEAFAAYSARVRRWI